jgi:hypothetical protein
MMRRGRIGQEMSDTTEILGPDLAARIAVLPARVDGDPVLQRRGRNLTATWQLVVGGDSFLVRIADSRVVEAKPAPAVAMSADFAMIAEPAVWERMLAAVPPPGDHDFFAFLKRGELRLVGNLHPLMSHLLYFKGLLVALRAGARP